MAAVSNIGMLDGAYFVGKNELLAWINSTRQLNLSKIEEAASGVVQCIRGDWQISKDGEMTSQEEAQGFHGSGIEGWVSVGCGFRYGRASQGVRDWGFELLILSTTMSSMKPRWSWSKFRATSLNKLGFFKSWSISMWCTSQGSVWWKVVHIWYLSMLTMAHSLTIYREIWCAIDRLLR